MKGDSSVIRVRPEALEVYKQHHAGCAAEVIDIIERCKIRDDSIYLKDNLVFGCFE